MSLVVKRQGFSHTPMMSFPPPDDREHSPWGEPRAHPNGPPTRPVPSAWGQQPRQAGWGQQQPARPYQLAGPAVNPYDSESTPILVTGILSLVLCGPIGIYAWIKGNDLRRRSEGAGWPEPSTAKVGRILGIVGTIIGIVQIAFMVIWVVLFFGTMSATTY